MQTLTLSSNTKAPKWDEIPDFLFGLKEDLESFKKILSNSNIQPHNEIEHPIDIIEASAFVKKEVPTLYTLVQKRKIPAHRQGKKLYFFKSELVAWIKDGENHSYYNKASENAEKVFSAANKKRRPQ